MRAGWDANTVTYALERLRSPNDIPDFIMVQGNDSDETLKYTEIGTILVRTNSVRIERNE